MFHSCHLGRRAKFQSLLLGSWKTFTLLLLATTDAAAAAVARSSSQMSEAKPRKKREVGVFLPAAPYRMGRSASDRSRGISGSVFNRRREEGRGAEQTLCFIADKEYEVSRFRSYLD